MRAPDYEWSEWMDFPDPRRGGRLLAPLGPGVYELRLKEERRGVLAGASGHCATRMTSLLPRPLGSGTRNNSAKRNFVLGNVARIEYRTRPFDSAEEAKRFEKDLLNGGGYEFNT